MSYITYDQVQEDPSIIAYKNREYRLKDHNEKTYSLNIESRSNYNCSGRYFITHYNAKDRRREERKIPKKLDIPTSEWNPVKVPEWFDLSENTRAQILSNVPDLFFNTSIEIKEFLKNYV